MADILYSYEEDYDPQGSDAALNSEPRRAAWQWGLLLILLFGTCSSYAYFDVDDYVVSELAVAPEPMLRPAPSPPARSNVIKVRPDTMSADSTIASADAPQLEGTITKITESAPSIISTSPPRIAVTPNEVPVTPALKPGNPVQPKRAPRIIDRQVTPKIEGETQRFADLTLKPEFVAPPVIVPPAPLAPLEMPAPRMPKITFRENAEAATAPEPANVPEIEVELPILAQPANPAAGAPIILDAMTDTRIVRVDTPLLEVLASDDTPTSDLSASFEAPKPLSESAIADAVAVPRSAAAEMPVTSLAANSLAAPIVMEPATDMRPVAPPPPPPFQPRFDFDGDYVVQVASFKSVVSACAVWEDLRAKHPRLFGEAETIVRPSNVAGGRQVYRLRVGAFAKRGHADEWCKAYKADGGECFVTKR